MSATPKAVIARPLEYPESDGQPIAENTLQFRWIVTIHGGLDALFAADPHVFVAGDLLWYPVEGDNLTRIAPDAMVVFGRPKGERGSYRQWDEEGIAPQVTFEVLSPSNRFGEMQRKLRFYEKYGVEEYYVYDPEDGSLAGWQRDGEALRPIPHMQGWVSPRLQVTFHVDGNDLRLTGPDGRPFVSYLELAEQREVEERKRREAEKQRANADKRRLRTERLRQEEEQMRLQAEQRANEEERKRSEAEDAVAALRAKLKALGVDPDA